MFTLLDERVAKLHPSRTPAHDVSRVLQLPAGESTKSITRLDEVLRAMARANLDRTAACLRAIGGGTIGDLGGLAAALYMRGIRSEQVPTTLLAMVDSSVGGKTAINLPEAKNLVGAFWSPAEVFIDPEFLTTLDDSDFRSGLGEVLKIAIGLDAELFELCERNAALVLGRDLDVLGTVIERALRAKIQVVEADFRETGARRLLNLGHTLGHALESARNYRIPHGVAVARGTHFAVDLAQETESLNPADAARIRALLEAFGFGPDPLESRAELMPFLRRDKKRAGEMLNAVLPTGIGSSTVAEMPVARFAMALAAE